MIRVKCSTSKHRIRAALLAALPALFLAVSQPGHAAPASCPVLAVDPLPGLAEVETRSEALRRWVSKGFTKAVLLNIDTWDGMRPLGTTAALALAAIDRAGTEPQRGRNAMDGPGKRALFEESFVRAAISIGIVREVFWIAPPNLFPDSDPSGFLRTYLKAAGFVEEDLRTFALRNGCFRGTAAGIPFAICRPAELPQIVEPVLLSVNPDFLLAVAAAGRTNPLAEIKKLVTALAEKKYPVVDAVLSASDATGRPARTKPDLRWVGEAFAQSIRDPSLLIGPDKPKRWSALQTLAAFEAARNFPGLLHEALPYLMIHDEDPALQLYAAEALAGQGRLEEALDHARKACQLHPGYCSGLPWIGLSLFAAGNVDGGERFFAAGAEMQPQLRFGQATRGLWLQNASRRAEALTVFQRLSDEGEAFPASFLAGALHLSNGDQTSARRDFERGLQALQDEPPAQVIDPDIAEAIKAAARFFRGEGLVTQAEQLEGDARLSLRREEIHPSP